MGKRPLTELIKEHQQLVAEVARLQAEVDRERSAALAALPATYGYLDMDSFIKPLFGPTVSRNHHRSHLHPRPSPSEPSRPSEAA